MLYYLLWPSLASFVLSLLCVAVFAVRGQLVADHQKAGAFEFAGLMFCVVALVSGLCVLGVLRLSAIVAGCACP